MRKQDVAFVSSIVVACFAYPHALHAQSGPGADAGPPAANTPPANPAPPAAPASDAPAPAAPPAIPPSTAAPAVEYVPPPLPPTAATIPVEAAPPPPPPDASFLGLQAGWRNGSFFVSDASHENYIVPTGRLNVDGFAYVGNGIGDSYTTSSGAYHAPDTRDSFIIRRARIEAAGRFFGRYSWFIAGDFSTFSNGAALTDGWVSARYCKCLNFQIGQFDAPFTMENRTSDKFIDFNERSLAVRNWGEPNNKEMGLMVWGELGGRTLYYSLGVFNGDGQNRVNRDNYFDFMGRIALQPFYPTSLPGVLRDLRIGGSLHVGYRGSSVDYPVNDWRSQAGSTGALGYTFFTGALAGGSNPITMVPDGDQLGVAGEFFLPIDWFDIRGELIYRRNGTAEMPAAAADTAHLVGDASRRGWMEGLGYYVQVGVWAHGTPRVNGLPGTQAPVDLKWNEAIPAVSPWSLQFLVRFDGIDAHYNGGVRTDQARNGTGLPLTTNPRYDGHYAVYAVELGVNLWLTKHVRLTLNYMEYFFPGQPTTTTPTMDDNHIHGPHNNAASFGEIGTRFAVAL